MAMISECRYLPMVPLRGIVVFPNTVINFEVARKASVQAINEAVNKDSYVFFGSPKKYSC